MKNIFYLFIVIILLFSCQENNNKEETKQQNKDKQSEKIKSKLVWTINPDACLIKWTGFKTTKKVAVKGEFKQFNIKGVKRDVDLPNTILNAEVSINYFSVFSDNEERDVKLIKKLFEKMIGKKNITAKIKSINIKDKVVDVIIDLNNHKKKKTMFLSIDDKRGIIIIKGKIDLLKDFSADKALSSFHKACFDKHKGKDGISKTWSEVEVEAILKFYK